MNSNDLSQVTRVEVIDEKGRSYVNWNKDNEVTVSMQDDGRTMKVFISRKTTKKPNLFLDVESYRVIHDKDYPPEMFKGYKTVVERRSMTEEEINKAAERFTKMALGLE